MVSVDVKHHAYLLTYSYLFCLSAPRAVASTVHVVKDIAARMGTASVISRCVNNICQKNMPIYLSFIFYIYICCLKEVLP